MSTAALTGAKGTSRPGWLRRWPVLGALLALGGLLSAGCYTGTGTYPVEIFPEMHYQQSFDSYEPPRISVPPDSVPRQGRAAVQSGAELYAVNCAMCHGVGGEGDGLVLDAAIKKYNYTPVLDPDLTSDAVQNMTDDSMREIIVRGVNLMPAFSGLLTPEEQQLIIDYVQSLQ